MFPFHISTPFHSGSQTFFPCHLLAGQKVKQQHPSKFQLSLILSSWNGLLSRGIEGRSSNMEWKRYPLTEQGKVVHRPCRYCKFGKEDEWIYGKAKKLYPKHHFPASVPRHSTEESALQRIICARPSITSMVISVDERRMLPSLVLFCSADISELLVSIGEQGAPIRLRAHFLAI